nr:histidine phosphatase family protein [Liquorilactobacillus satsumensis]
MVVHFYLVRHGQTRLNRMHRLQGITDSPLTKKGGCKSL